MIFAMNSITCSNKLGVNTSFIAKMATMKMKDHGL
jgi:hypothetical protein